jgi:exopolysaccharide biosynthesis operon protein EpsL
MRRLLAIALLMTGASLALPAAAQQERPVMAVVGGSVSWNSNVFSLPDSADPQTRLGRPSKSDRILSHYAGVRVDKPYALQRFVLDATVTSYRYQTFTHLNFDATEYRGAWHWHLTPRLSGTLSADRSQSLVNYSDFQNFSERNVRTTENRVASADWWLFGGWHLVGALSQRASKTSQPLADEGSFRADGVEGGVKYVAGAGSSIGLNVRALDGKYTDRPVDPVNFLGDGFRRDETEVVASWIATARSTLEARLARIEYREEPFAVRDFSGSAARLGWRWAPAAKLSLNLAASREQSPWRDVFATYKVDEQVSAGAALELAARTTLRVNLTGVESDYRNPIVALAGPRRDRSRSEQLAIEWRAWRNLAVNASLAHQRRTSTEPSFEFSGTIATLGASLMF